MQFNYMGGQPFSRRTLELWLRSPRGRALLALEERELKRVLPDLFGRHLLQVGSWGRDGQLLAACEMLHRAVLGTVGELGAQALAAPERLPVQDRSVDAVLLPHCLEFSRSPHRVLGEANRILNERGRLIVLGFSPWSWWAVRQRLGLRYRAFPPGARFVSVGRLCDWLELLDFEVTEVRRYGVGFPWTQPVADTARGVERWFGVWSEGYLLVAKKRVIPLTLVGRTQKSAVRPLLGGITLPGGSATRVPTPGPDRG
ncbi:MAG TPA: methyltransferase domain-containing protein [Candidatus Binatia bacterium]|nr:methyltransferase domain-containing protein [Candidatus Binatia bacterium]